MSYNINLGEQIIFFDYKEEALGQKFNRINYRLASHGIYEGGLITRVGNSQISISPFVSYVELLESAPYPAMGVRIQSTSSATITLSSTSLTLIIGRFAWSDETDNFMEFKAIADSEILASDIVFGRVKFNGANIEASPNHVNYSEKSWAYNYYNDTLNYKPPFKVEPDFPRGSNSTKVRVYPGSRIINGKQVSLTATFTLSPAFSSTTLGRKDILYINDAGTLVVEEGVDAGSPVLKEFNLRYLPIAIISRGANATSVLGEHVEYIHPNSIISGLPSETTNTYFIIDTDAGSAVRLVNNSGALHIKNKAGDAFADFTGKDGTVTNLTVGTLLTSPTIYSTVIRKADSAVNTLTFLANGQLTVGAQLNTLAIVTNGNITATGTGIITGVGLTIGATASTIGGALAVTGELSTTTFKATNIKHGSSVLNDIVLSSTGAITLNGPTLTTNAIAGTTLTLSGVASIAGTLTTYAITPNADSLYDIGTSANRFANIYGDKCYGAVGNDYADVYNCKLSKNDFEYGKVYVANDSEYPALSCKYAQKGIIGITSNQFSFLAGKGLGLPIAVSGFLDIELPYKEGTALTCGRGGSLVKANLLVKMFFPERILAVVIGKNKIRIK